MEIKFWLIIFDFKLNQIIKQRHIWFPELEIKYEPEGISISACTEPTRVSATTNCVDFTQNF